MSIIEAINGLMINNDYIDIVSNNIANASTIGFKSSTPSFFDIVSHSFYSNQTIKSGVGISNLVQNFSDGVLVQTDRDLDLGIVRDGFFRVLDSKGYVHYTRNGHFLLDKNKNIVNAQGMYLTGQNQFDLKNDLNNVSNLEPINLRKSDLLRAKATNEIKLKANLIRDINSTNDITGTNDNISNTETHNITIYDENKNPQELNISFNRIDNNQWKLNIKLSDKKIPVDEIINNNFILKFDSEGKLISNSSLQIKSKNSKNIVLDGITLNIECALKKSETDTASIELSQNGYSEGSLEHFEILNNGEIIGQYTNEQEQKIGQIFLSKFINPEKLKPESGSIWSATNEAGKEKIGAAGDRGFGILYTKSLEASNVDLNKELINMIVAQRNYQSSAQAFKTEDKIINTLVNLK
ncbi:flagellar hook protein FlgE [Buchnera aphidicola (Rhopalosiphum padi)]|uniref:Flagellar hook protein FlgE n=1 Tax=Buchnera aphidicola subsp. Rhopalosiphum padi TaxID=98793 RepID=A0A4D6YJW9_BUCRP|nr:flagellar hook protein FlgE [Buchnera aphidicola]QCI24975.1 flagellar hook protein FlgE [Buchnera aphidicola (Rhopalosiphum padi)]